VDGQISSKSVQAFQRKIFYVHPLGGGVLSHSLVLPTTRESALIPLSPPGEGNVGVLCLRMPCVLLVGRDDHRLLLRGRIRLLIQIRLSGWMRRLFPRRP
jgi:hypothetical protein